MADWTVSTNSGFDIEGLDSDSSGNTYYAALDSTNDVFSLTKVDSTGSEQWRVTRNTTDNFDSMDVRGGDIAVTLSSEVYIFDDAGNETAYSDFPNPNGDVIVVNSSDVAIPSGSEYKFEIWDVSNDFASPSFTNPNNYYFEAAAYNATNDEYYVGDSNGYMYTLDSNLTQTASGQPISGSHADMLYDGGIYISTGFDGKLARIDETDITSTIWETTTGATIEGIDTVSADSNIYTALAYINNPLQHGKSDGSEKYTYSTSKELDYVTVTSSDKSVWGDVVNNEVLQLDDSNWNNLYITTTATQPSVASTVNAANTSSFVLVYASMNDATVTSLQTGVTQATSTATMNPDAAITKNLVDSSPIAGTATMNVVDPLDEFIDTVNVPEVTASPASTDIEFSETTIFIETEQGLEYVADGILYEGEHPFLQKSATTTLTLIVDGENYEELRTNHARYLTEDTVNVTKSFYNEPQYRQTINPLSSVSSYLWKFDPLDTVTGVGTWWVVVTDINDATVQYGTGEQVEVELLPLKKDEGETFTQISEEYEV